MQHPQDVNELTRPESLRPQDFAWKFWFTVPLYPYGQRRTLRQEVVKDTIWTFDQIQGIVYTTVPIRMTVVKLAAGGLLIYAPVAPTPECIRLVQELVAQHGEVRYIILPTTSGLEHKVFVGPFSRQFPTAQVYVAPNQWSFPVNLPLSWLGFPRDRTHILPANSADAPFAADFDYAILDINLGQGSFGEVAFFHRRSQTLLVTDSVVAIPEDPPPIVQLDPYPLLFHARDHAFDVVTDTPETRRKGWQRISLFAFYFRPSALEPVNLGAALKQARQAPDRSRKAYFGFFPFNWKADWHTSFEALRGHGRLFVAPVLQTLILSQEPQQTLDWANQVARWNFTQVISCHFQAPVPATPQEFRRAFSFLERQPALPAPPLPEVDFEFLRELEVGLAKRGVISPPKPKV